MKAASHHHSFNDFNFYLLIPLGIALMLVACGVYIFVELVTIIPGKYQ
ncbi:hypothetical protein [Mucilaginibacter gynuensis]